MIDQWIKEEAEKYDDIIIWVVSQVTGIPEEELYIVRPNSGDAS